MPPTYDLWDFLANNTPNQGLAGSHFLKCLKVDDTNIYHMKMATGQMREHYELVDGNIYLRSEDGCSLTAQCWGVNDWNPNNVRRWLSYLWSPRYVTDGQAFTVPAMTEYYEFDTPLGRVKKTVPFESYPCYVNVLTPENSADWQRDIGGTVGICNKLIAITHFWKTRILGDYANCEQYFYDEWRGLVICRGWDAGALTLNVLFNVDIYTEAQPIGPAVPDLTGFTQCGT